MLRNLLRRTLSCAGALLILFTPVLKAQSAPSPQRPNITGISHVEGMRSYLRANGYDVKPGNGGKTRTGDCAFEIKDPDGMLVEFVQGLPSGLEAQAAGKFAPATRISTKIYHVGFLVGNSQRSLDFYGKLLGFQETWRGGANPEQLSWINMRVPNGEDYLEFMLYSKMPDKLGTKNHISLEVPDVQAAVRTLEAGPPSKPMERVLRWRPESTGSVRSISTIRMAHESN